MRHCFDLDGADHLVWLTRDKGVFRLLADEASATVSLQGDVLKVDDEEYPVRVVRSGDHLFIHLAGVAYELTFKDPATRHAAAVGGGSFNVLRAPMPGAVVAIFAAAGQFVNANDTLLVIESMKLETAIRAPRDAWVETFHVAASQSFERDAALVTLAPPMEPG